MFLEVCASAGSKKVETTPYITIQIKVPLFSGGGSCFPSLQSPPCQVSTPPQVCLRWRYFDNRRYVKES